MIYLDNAATTAVCKEAKEAMVPLLEDEYGNPSANYPFGDRAGSIVERARIRMAGMINANPENIIFTSGGTESDNSAVLKIKDIENSHIITTKIEHHAILNTCEYARKKGAEVTYLNVNPDGEINIDELEKSIKENTRLISVMFANNEIGTIEPIAKIGRLARAYGITFHTDAVQAFGHVPINVARMNIDLMSVSAHKFNGPKGVGFLYVRNIDDFEPLIWGGGQENGKRSGTENVAGIAGMEQAAIQSIKNMSYRMQKEQYLRNYLINRVMNEIDDVKLNGHKFKRLPGNANFSFKNINAAKLVEDMGNEGICISAGSACAAAGGKPSQVIMAINVQKEYAYGTVRITISHENTRDEIDRTVEIMKKLIKLQREQ
ncbi:MULTISPECIES: cysteine desulfurase family protein [unclassified Eubacterium (in: firmicutes)]|uniref:cysteine desulfurase family protein n=1 Tax=unclassified Eubacterium (in: firmicutes) TaxID=2624479 RepID=UPI000E48BC8B|nr:MULTISPECIES: cysteine desulfurase family protein [unclassified Eubacterium (in: firmicutes)]RGG66434.1 cysteine desulfurase [Eubacterium sp. AF17-7]RHR33334.1 cysteine desulfurase [Eubacterium sp. AF19-12LB]